MRARTRRNFSCIKVVPVLLVFVACPAALVRADWNTYQGNAGHTGYVPGVTQQPSNWSLRWSQSLSTSYLGGLAVGGNGVYVKGPNVSITAVNEQTGAISWTNSYTPGVGHGQVDTTSAPAYSNGMVYYQTDNEADVNLFHGVSATTGAQVFATRYGAQWETYLNPTPFGGTVYTGGGTYGGIYAYNGTTGAEKWFGYEGQYDGWTPSVDGNYAYSFTGTGDTVPIYGEFRMINLATGATKYLVTDTNYQWSGYTMNSAVVLGAHNDAFVINQASSAAGRLLCFATEADSADSPHIMWVKSDHFVRQPTLANGVLFADDGGSVAALDELTGDSLWNWTPASGNLTGTMIVTDNMLFASTNTTIYAVDLNSHAQVWSYAAGGNMALSDNTLFVSGTNGTLYAFAVPEPSTFGLCVLGMLCALARRSRRAVKSRTSLDGFE